MWLTGVSDNYTGSWWPTLISLREGKEESDEKGEKEKNIF